MKRLLTNLLCAAMLTNLLCCIPVSAEETAAVQTVTQTSAASSDLSPEAVYKNLIAFQKTYPEGTPYTNENYYIWHGANIIGYGCAGFAFMLSDGAFGELPARMYTDYTKLRVGDLLRMYNDTHTVVVLEIYDSYIVVAEGNYNGTVHWGRKIQMTEVFSASTVYAYTRYPEEVSGVFGDVTMDGSVDVKDAQAALVAAGDIRLGLKPSISAEKIAAADVDGDGSCTVKDAQYILVYYANTRAGIVCSWRTLTGNPDAPASRNIQ